MSIIICVLQFLLSQGLVGLLCLLLSNFFIMACDGMANNNDQIKPTLFGFKNGLLRTVRPVLIAENLREKREFNTSEQNGQEYPLDELTIAFSDHPFILDLKLNRGLIPNGNVLSIHHHRPGEEFLLGDNNNNNKNGNHSKLCHYQGRIRNISDSWVAISACSGLSGVIFDGQVVHYIEPSASQSYSSNMDQDHLLMKHSDLPFNNINMSCANPDQQHHHDLGPFFKETSKENRPHKKVKRQAGGRLYVELAIIVDYTIYLRYDGDSHQISEHVLSVVNIINQIYLPLNIFITLSGIILWSAGDHFNIGIKVLDDFSNYRDRHLHKNHHHDVAYLLVGFNTFDGPVGKAFVNTMCETRSACGYALDEAHFLPAFTASIVSHEMGHNFGLHHDDSDGCSCADNQCVMTSSILSNNPTKRWSSCSRESFRNNLPKFNCLHNKPQSCGNMIVEEGEECDCGLKEYCTNPCCDPATCRMKSGAYCASGACCDLKRCSLKTAGTECRAIKVSSEGCDLSEYCTGTSTNCPNDLHKFDGSNCSSHKVCVGGKCAFRGSLSVRVANCPTNCSSPNGECNNLGKCHCDIGFSPETDCQAYGTGGSVDGGPAMDPEGFPTFYLGLYVFFLAILPVVLFLIFLWYLNLNLNEKELVKTKILGGKATLYHGNDPKPITIKRDFGAWVKDKVQLKLPLVRMPESPTGLSPVSGGSTASTTLNCAVTPSSGQPLLNYNGNASPLSNNVMMTNKPSRLAPPPPPPAQHCKPNLILKVHPAPPPPLSSAKPLLGI